MHRFTAGTYPCTALRQGRTHAPLYGRDVPVHRITAGTHPCTGLRQGRTHPPPLIRGYSDDERQGGRDPHPSHRQGRTHTPSTEVGTTAVNYVMTQRRITVTHHNAYDTTCVAKLYNAQVQDLTTYVHLQPTDRTTTKQTQGWTQWRKPRGSVQWRNQMDMLQRTIGSTGCRTGE